MNNMVFTYRGIKTRLKPIKEIKDPEKRKAQWAWAWDESCSVWRPEEHRAFFRKYLFG